MYTHSHTYIEKFKFSNYHGAKENVQNHKEIYGTIGNGNMHTNRQAHFY